MINQKSFVLYASWWDGIKNLSMEERGQLFSMIMEWENNHKILKNKMNKTVQIIWDFIFTSLKINKDKYEEKCKRNRAINQKRWKKNIPDVSQTTPNAGDNDNEYDNVNDNDNDNVNDNDNNIKKINKSKKISKGRSRDTSSIALLMEQ